MIRSLLGFSVVTLMAGCVGDKPTDATDPETETGDVCVANPDACDEDGDGFRPSDGDCDDGDASINPAEEEICDGRDQDCDSAIDEDVTTSFYQDFDEDGFGNPAQVSESCEAPVGYVANGTDCDDGEPTAYPGSNEVCDGVDNDCDDVIDNGVTTPYFADADGDEYGDPDAGTDACSAPVGYVTDDTDCDDTTNDSFPGNSEICDELDNNCDGTVDEGVTTTYYADFDGDNYGNSGLTEEACSTPTGYTSDSTDCDDYAAAVNPGETEVCNDVDDDCDSTIDENDAADAATWYIDADSDAYGDASISTVACDQPLGYVSDNTDCDDARDLSNPSATEYCNTYDDDCDGTTDEDSSVDAATWYLDADSDLYGNSLVSTVECYQPSGYVSDNTDCNDGSARANPGYAEVCDYMDNNCDGVTDEDTATDASVWYEDADSDTYGNSAVSDTECWQPSGYVSSSTDCDDTRAASYPGAPEYCNTYDDNCDGTVDEDSSLDALTWYADSDVDLYGDAAVTYDACAAPSGYVADDTDCDDTRALTNPAATEYCNSIDDDCDGTTDEDSAVDALTWYLDYDSDGYGTPATSDIACTAPSGYVSDNNDCIDTSAISYPGATEICDGLDNDCDGTADDDPTGGTIYYADNDSDGFGDPANTTEECSLPSGYAENYYDCNDGDSGEPVVADVASGAASGTGTLANPYDTIQDAVDNSFECVVVYQGTYNEELDLGAGRSIDIWGVEGSDLTIIDANLAVCGTGNPSDCNAAVTIDSASGAAPSIHGFTITGGTGKMESSSTSTTCADSSASHSGRTSCTVYTYEYCGGGVYVNGDDPYLYDVIIRDNTLPEFEQTAIGSFTQYWMYSYGGGVCLVNSNASFETSIIEGNDADQGGGIYAENGSSFEFSQGYVSENSASDGGGVNLSGASGTFTNAVVACNAADTDGGGLFTESSGTSVFTNTVLYGNSSSTSGSSRGAEAYIGTSTTFNLYNSIVQSSTIVYAIYGAGGSGTQEYNNVYNGGGGSGYGGTLSAGSGAISAGSNFTSASCDNNPYNDDFSLRSSSSSVDAGNPSASYNDADGSANDQGAFGGPDSEWEF